MLQEIRVCFRPVDENRFQVQFTNVAGTAVGVAGEFTPFLTEDDYENLRWYLEEYMDLPDGGAVTRAAGIEQQLHAWGRRLHDDLFTAPENRAVLRQLLDSPEPRELTIATDLSVLLRLPWELLADDAGSLAQRVSVRRQLETPVGRNKSSQFRQDSPDSPDSPVSPAAGTAKTCSGLPLRLLYVVSRPADTGFIDPRLTTKSLFAALDPLGSRVRIDFCRPPTLARMEEMLRAGQVANEPYDVVHFDGHGTFLPQAQIGALCFEKPDDGSGESHTDYVRADRLGTLLAEHRIPLVVLEACRSATVGKTAVFRSVAPRLIQAGVGSVLSMGHAVHVEAARLLLDRFYRELVRGTTIGHAVAEARKALVSTPARWIESGPKGRTIDLEDFFLPHLYQLGADSVLFRSAKENAFAERKPTNIRQFDLFLSHNKNNKPRVESIARLLVEKHGLRVWFDAWEMEPGTLEQQCERGIRNCRFTVVAVSAAALQSKWVQWEIATALRLNQQRDRILPLRLEAIEPPGDLGELLWVDFLDPADDAENAARLAAYIRSADAEDARRRRGFRPPAESGQPGSFPRPPQYGFHGRARELYDLERQFRRQRGIVLHAMGGMGKTTLATEAADWWTRSGLFRDGACFVSFEQFTSADRVVQVLGNYCEGPKFDQRPAVEQRRRAIEFLRDRAVLLVWDNFESTLPSFNRVPNGPRGGAPEKSAPLAPLRGEGLGVRGVVDGGGVSESPSDPSPPAPLPEAGRGEHVFKDATPHTHAEHVFKDASPYTDDERRRLADLFHDLTTGPGLGGVLVTCRPGETGLPSAGRMELHGLARPDSLWLLHRILERDGLTLSDRRFAKDELDPLLVDLADHPLSLELVGPHLKTLTPAAIRQDFGKLLATFENQGADQARNRSLLASLEFSRRHLSPAARAALPWLGLFSGGVFEFNLLNMSQIEPAAWEPIRAELQGIALLRPEFDLQIANRPFLRFHPTLAIASADRSLADQPATRQRFIDVYLKAMQMLDKMLRGSHSRAALEILNREESNYCTAVRWAVADQQHQAAAALGHTFHEYLRMSGRLREQDAWVEWLRDAVTQAGFTEEAAAYELHHAWTLFTQGDSQAAVDKLQALIARLRQTAEFDPAFQMATAVLTLGRVLLHAGASAQAIPVLQEAVIHWETLAELAHEGTSGASQPVPAGELGNLSATLGDLANALRYAGKYAEALVVAEKALAIQTALGNQRNVACGHDIIATILNAAGRSQEAEARYDMAFAAARQAGDKELEGMLLQHQGVLASNRNQLARANGLYQQALQRFQEAANTVGVMKTYNLLGVAEQKAGRLAEARAWYEKSRELAVVLNNTPCLGQAAQNIGVICAMEGEAADQCRNDTAAQRHFAAARCSLEESLRLDQALKNKPQEADALGNLARVHLRLGDLAAAERDALAAREIHESLGLNEVHYDYNTLSEIAAARGDARAAAEWARKRDALRAELKRRAGGGGLPAQMLQALQQLAIACAQAGFGDAELDPGAEEALATLAGYPAPFPDLVAYLRQLAAGVLPPLPASLPAELQQLLAPLADAIREASS